MNFTANGSASTHGALITVGDSAKANGSARPGIVETAFKPSWDSCAKTRKSSAPRCKSSPIILIALFAVIRIVTLRAVEERCCHDNCGITINERTQCLEGCQVQASRQEATRRILSNVRSKGNKTAFIRHRNRVQQVRPLVPRRLVLCKTPAAAAVDHAAAAITPTERQEECVDVCQEYSDCHRQRRPSWHRPSRASTHRAKQVLGSANTFLQSTVQILVCVLEKQKRGGAQGGRSTGGTAGWQRYMRYGPDINNHARWQHTHPFKKRKQRNNTAAGCGCVCGAAGVCPPWPQRKQNKRERNVCSAPQALVARPHVTAPSARRSSRPLLMRAAGEAHRAVVMSVSVGVRVEQLGGKHTAPLTGRVQQKQLKRGKSIKNVHSDCPQKQRKEKGWE
ncbi:hypothetical protein ECC02_012030 [Trypanosoma cruzi]|uniref:Uncharacterized protein n=1 Tax=Trypanosoma cruzi TaxID=5693 RepID=A0A7J6XLG7_TRYCR|nr:hypothetical protein ECC02_012030 [Trypanosoma cruzi]